MAEQNPESWHLDRKVPVAIIATLMLQIVGFGWLFGQVEERVTQLERRLTLQGETIRNMPERMARLEEQMLAVRGALERIEKKLDESR